jgi:hypothetical protein
VLENHTTIVFRSASSVGTKEWLPKPRAIGYHENTQLTPDWLSAAQYSGMATISNPSTLPSANWDGELDTLQGVQSSALEGGDKDPPITSIRRDKHVTAASGSIGGEGSV